MLLRHNFKWLAKGGERSCVCGQFCCSVFQLSLLRFWLDVAEVEAAAFRHRHRRELAPEGEQVEALVEGRRELRQAHRQVAERAAQSSSHHHRQLLIEPC